MSIEMLAAAQQASVSKLASVKVGKYEMDDRKLILSNFDN